VISHRSGETEDTTIADLAVLHRVRRRSRPARCGRADRVREVQHAWLRIEARRRIEGPRTPRTFRLFFEHDSKGSRHALGSRFQSE
jgi:hypothetical protein